MKHFKGLISLLLALLLIFSSISVFASETASPEETDVAAGETDQEEDNRWREGFSPLSGVPVSEDHDNRRVFAYSVDNMIPARWHAGLRSAEIIFEFKNELNTSRFVALFMTQPIPERIGPLRSARPFMIHRLIEYDAVFSHAGGSGDGNQAISDFNVNNYDAIYLGLPYFWRYYDTGKVSPHNLYASMTAEIANAETFGISLEPSDFVASLFQEEVLPLEGEPALTFEVQMAPGNVKRYEYDDETKTYLRYEDGLLHIDELDGLPLTPVNVIVQEALSTVYDASGHRAMAQTGEGAARYFSHGEVIDLTWEKEDERARTIFRTEDGEELIHNPGQLFIQVVDSLDDVTILLPEPAATETETTP